VDPDGGYGMNAGIADAHEPLVAARGDGCRAGWRRSGLDAHEAERQPITEQVSKFAMNHALAMQASAKACPKTSRRRAPRAKRCAPRAGRRCTT
jgi:2-polyprenyl-6-methoxyphenol hydroxylase-like FAD-dependent oxidoreductase